MSRSLRYRKLFLHHHHLTFPWLGKLKVQKKVSSFVQKHDCKSNNIPPSNNVFIFLGIITSESRVLDFFLKKSDKYKLHWSISSVWVSMLWSLALKANVRGITAPELRCLLTVAIKIKMNVCLLFLWVGACFLPGLSVSLRLIMFAVIHSDRLQHKETRHGTVCVSE